MTGTKAIVLAATVAVTAFLAVLFVRLDYFPGLHTYGVTVGTNTSYCSLDLVNWLPVAACEKAS